MKPMSFERFDVYFEEVAGLSRNEQTLLIAELADEIAAGNNVIENLQNVQLIIDIIACEVDKSLINDTDNTKTYTPNPTSWDLKVN